MANLFKKVLFFILLPCLFLFGCHPRQEKRSTPPPQEPIEMIKDGAWNTEMVDISKIHPDKKLVALTFDDSPTDKLDALLEVFISFNKTHHDCPATATLFCNGRGLNKRFKESLYTAFTLGMELGNHSFSHHDLTTLSAEQIQEEIGRVDELLQEIDGNPLHLFRAPYGRTDERVLEQVAVPVIDWFADTRDWSDRSADQLIKRTFEKLEDGAIVLLHDGYESTIAGIERLLPALYEKGYQAVSVSQMAKAHGCRLKVGKVYTRARKQ
ncbi:MAG: polysaccharide deacetylase family protein [Clostridia bacterium]|nr:polysaccharide deacetylase family protein [Clostridia bacterium]